MKILKINQNLKINIEQIYSLECVDNKKDINNWNESYKKYIELYANDPISLPITEDRVFMPIMGEQNNEDDLKLYANALHNHILTIIGTQPKLVKKYYILLITGLKINISKDIYDKVNEVLDKYLI